MALRIEHVQSETSGDFQKALLCMLQAEEAPFDLEARAEFLIGFGPNLLVGA